MSSIPAAILLQIHAFAEVSPLLGAVLAPFSILFDIPALTEPWFIRFDPNVLLDPNKANSVPDHTASVSLSAIGLGFNAIANALLIVRFSTSARWWRIATRLSLVFWISKVIIALINLCVFGRKEPETVRGEGLWCAVVSLIICGIITLLLVLHWAFEIRNQNRGHKPTEEQLAVRVAGRHFMINVTLFVIDVALLALLSSRIESWTYLQGIYYGVITFLTIGFGDFYPTHTVTRVLLFIFAILGIAQLGNIVSMLVNFFSSRAEEKRAISRAEFEKKRQEEQEHKPGTTPDLHQEIEFLHRLSEQQEARIRLEQLTTSIGGLVIFWVVGAAVFSQLEGWAYGTAMYFGYVSFLTIGYGEYAPITAAGRVVFVLYSLIAVPIMASFAVQAVQQVFSAFSDRQYDRTKAKRGLEPGLVPTTSKRHLKVLKHDVEDGLPGDASKDPGPMSKRDVNNLTGYGGEIVPHSELAEQWHREWEKRVRSHRAEGYSEGAAQKLADVDIDADKEQERTTTTGREHDETATNDWDIDNVEAEEQEREFDEDAQLTERILELAISLEWRARKLLILHLDNDVGGKAARIVLKADRNIQVREVKGLVRELKEEQERTKTDKEEETQVAVDEQLNRDLTQDQDKNADKVKASSSHPLLDGTRAAGILQHVLREGSAEVSSPLRKDERETLEDVRQYREDFAGLLAAGSRLMGLKGNERALFERRRLRELRQRSNGGNAA